MNHPDIYEIIRMGTADEVAEVIDAVGEWRKAMRRALQFHDHRDYHAAERSLGKVDHAHERMLKAYDLTLADLRKFAPEPGGGR